MRVLQLLAAGTIEEAKIQRRMDKAATIRQGVEGTEQAQLLEADHRSGFRSLVDVRVANTLHAAAEGLQRRAGQDDLGDLRSSKTAAAALQDQDMLAAGLGRKDGAGVANGGSGSDAADSKSVAGSAGAHGRQHRSGDPRMDGTDDDGSPRPKQKRRLDAAAASRRAGVVQEAVSRTRRAAAVGLTQQLDDMGLDDDLDDVLGTGLSRAGAGTGVAAPPVALDEEGMPVIAEQSGAAVEGDGARQRQQAPPAMKVLDASVLQGMQQLKAAREQGPWLDLAVNRAAASAKRRRRGLQSMGDALPLSGAGEIEHVTRDATMGMGMTDAGLASGRLDSSQAAIERAGVELLWGAAGGLSHGP